MGTQVQKTGLARISVLATSGCSFLGCLEESRGVSGDEEEPSKEGELNENDAQNESGAQSCKSRRRVDSEKDLAWNVENEGGAEPTPGDMHLKFKMDRPKGECEPRNAGAVRIQDDCGSFVRMTSVRAKKRAVHRVHWQANCDSERTDAISTATIESHQAHSISWALMGSTGKRLKQGAYALRVEINGENRSNESIDDDPELSVPFEPGAEGSDAKPRDDGRA